jgi:hypothetical protein
MQWNHLFYFLLQGIKKMFIFAWCLVFIIFFFKRSMQIPIKILTGSIQDKEIEYFTFSYILLKRKFCVASFWFLTIVILFVFVFFSFTPALKALQWNHLFHFLLQGIIIILKCSRYFICLESIKKMSIFAWYFFFSRDQCRFP